MVCFVFSRQFFQSVCQFFVKPPLLLCIFVQVSFSVKYYVIVYCLFRNIISAIVCSVNPYKVSNVLIVN